ncbi:MAG: DNA translocase FtsK, partial [bacterium]
IKEGEPEMWGQKKYNRFSTINSKTLKTSKTKKYVAYRAEVYGVLLSAVSLFFILAVFSYNPLDATLFSYNSGHDSVANLAGFFGAQLSAILLYLFGSSVYMVLACLVVPSVVLLCGHARPEQDDARLMGARGQDDGSQFAAGMTGWGFDREVYLRKSIVFMPSLAICSAVLCALYNVDFTRSYPGGVIGSYVAQVIVPFFGYFGGAIFLWAFFWICVAFLLRRSLVKDFVCFVRFIARNIWAGLCFFGRSLRNIAFKKREQTNVAGASAVSEKNVQDTRNIHDIRGAVDIGVHVLGNKTQNLDERDAGARETVDLAFWQQFADITLNTSTVQGASSGDLDAPFEFVNDREKLVRDLVQVLGAIGNIKVGAKKNKRLFKLPSLNMFKSQEHANKLRQVSQDAIAQGKKLEEKLQHFGIKGIVNQIKPGPLITMFEYQPEIDSKISKITALEDDLAMALAAISMRTLAPIPGKNAIGFEIANKIREQVLFSDVVATKNFMQTSAGLPIALGVDTVGTPVIEDLVSMPHLLIGGSTGSGKSVGLNAMVSSLLCARTPEQMKLILIDPKRLEFALYADIPHLLFPVITNPVHATSVLKWVVQEMEDRYKKMAAIGARNLLEYQEHEKMPYIVVVIDELADLMMVAGRDVEMCIVRIAQLARAAGIHMIVATQRPSVDVVTGLIKVNFPSRIAFRVSSKVDSRTILDQQGADRLLGNGDMLFKNSASPILTRIHGAYIASKEIEALTAHLKLQGAPEYLDLQDVLRTSTGGQHSEQLEEELYPEVLEFLKTVEEVSISSLQRQYRIGFNRSARIIERLEVDGYLAPAQGSKPRKVLY